MLDSPRYPVPVPLTGFIHNLGGSMRYKVLDVSTKRNGREVTFQVEVPQVDNLEELASFAGSAELALEWANSHLSTDAGNAGRPVVRDADEKVSDNDAISKAQAASKSYVPRGARAPGVKTKAGNFDELMALYGSGATPEEIQSKLEELAKKLGA